MQPALLADDLAPGDRGAADHDWRDLRIHRVRDASDADFELAWSRLWSEFGSRGEMESRDVIRARLAWDPLRPVGGFALAYELLLLRRGSEVVALRDHTAAVGLDAGGRSRSGPVVVHLSHALVEPPHRGTGLAAWLRALPLQAARRCAAAAGCRADAPVVLVAEMEPPDPAEPWRLARLRSYGRAGFRPLDPREAPYAQPDFRLADQPAGTRPRSLPLQLVLRRVGREGEVELPAAELAAVIAALYAIYGAHLPEAALAPVRADAERWLRRQERFRLLPPTA